MDESQEKKFSYPNSDQTIIGVSDVNRHTGDPTTLEPKPLVHILDALKGPKKEESSRTMRTYQEDITDAIKNDGVSMIKMALAEKKRQERQGTFDETLEKTDSTKKYMIFGGIFVIIIIVGLVALYMLVKNNGKVAEINTPQETQRLIYTETSHIIDVNNRSSDDIMRLIKREVGVKLDLGSMEELILTDGSGTSTRQISTEDFFKYIGARTPSALTRSLEPTFLLGVYSFSPHDLFALFKVNSYDLAFANMLQWEPDMEVDIGDMFITHKAVVAPIVTTASSSLSTSTVPTSGIPVGFVKGRPFTDKVVDNKDARVILNEDGTIALLYTFLDKNTLVIASSDKVLKEISFRLTAGRVAR